MASVRVAGLHKLYGSVVALSDINIDVPSGMFFTLLGPSGCGKTTLLRAIAGFHSQSAGDIFVDGQSIGDLPAHRRDVAMVFQDYAVFPHMSVRNNIEFGLKQRKVRAAEIKTRVDDVIDVVQLGKFADRMPHELSGGQQQRVGLARAIVVQPKVLLMDEPLSNLDAKLRVELRAELRRIQQDLGVTTIYVTHDQEEALAMSDVVCVMESGVIQQAEPPFEVYSRPSNRFVASFVGSNNFMPVDLNDSKFSLRATGEFISSSVRAPKSGSLVGAVRPEDFEILPSSAQTEDDKTKLEVPVLVQEVSYVGREIEVYGQTTNGEVIKAIGRPDAELIALAPLDEVVFRTQKEKVLFFVDEHFGERI